MTERRKRMTRWNSIEEKASRFEVNRETGCWEWFGSKAGAYGIIRHKGKVIGAHRYMYALHNGPIPPGALICHACDNPPCVNPGHLFVGTHKDNTADMHRKGRANIPRGSAHSFAKLTERDVVEIRQSDMNVDELAERFGVSRWTIYDARSGRCWSHV